MVRPDPSRDLYADLEISPQCSQDDIKKQFHKLALKYHPDRNPGHEAEYATKFQTIQAANEILSNPEQRRKYDVSRPLGSGTTTSGGGSAAPAFQRPAASGVRGNPYKAESAFPPPPRRTAAGNAPPPSRNAPAAASAQDVPHQPPLPSRGADRYAFAKPPQPPPKPTTAAQAARNRMDNARAWETMASARPEPSRTSTPQGNVRPVPPAWTGHRYADDEIPRPSSERVPHRSAFETVRGSPRPKTGRTSSRRFHHTFDPGSPLGDEGPAAASAYTSVSFDRPPDPGPPRPPSSRKSTNEDADPAVDIQPRQHRPYGTVRRETTYFDGPSSEGLRRAMSVKDATKLHHSAEHGEGSEASDRRHRSLSPRRRSPPDVDGEDAPYPPRPRQRQSFRVGDMSSDSDSTSPIHRPSPAHNLRKESLTASSSDPNMRRRSSHSAADHLSPTGDGRHPHFSESYEEFPRRASHGSAVPSSATDNGSSTYPAARSPTSPRKAPFPSEQWQREFREDDGWAQNMSDMEAGGGMSPTKTSSSNSRRSRTAPVRPAMKQPSNSNNSQASTGLDTGLADLGVNDNIAADPMDLDEPPSPNTRNLGPRNVYVEPNRPEWRDSSSNNRHNPSSRPPSIPSMDSFRHVAPFDTKTSGGVNNLSDLKSSLPFQSQPSSLHPSRTASYQDGNGQTEYQFPPMPIAPVPPAFPTSPNKWVGYLRDMNAYFKQWTKTYSTFISHFQDHATRINDMANGPAGGMVDGWLGAVGETGHLAGFGTYASLLEEDAKWRKAWVIACEKHVETMRAHSEIRRGVMEGRLRTSG